MSKKVLSKCGKKDILIDEEGYEYCVDRDDRDTHYFKCINFSRCSGRGKALNGDQSLFQMTAAHTHPPDENSTERR